MSERLRTVLDRAADQDFAPVDLDAITRAGDRSVRRRRVATGAAGVAAVGLVATGAVLLGDDEGGRRTDFVDRTFETDVPMWTVGSTLHTPDATHDLGVDVASFVRTSEGIVFLGWEGGDAFGVYSFTGEDEPARIGETGDSQLRSDPEQPYAGWLDGAGDDLTAAIYDQASGRRVHDAPARLENSFPVVAIDGTTAYLADADEGPVLALDLETGERTDLPDDDAWRGFLAAKDELVARHARTGNRSVVEVGPPGATGVALDAAGADGAVLSPDGDWISIINNTVGVFDTATGREIPLDTQGFSDGFGYEWLDRDTVMVAGASAGASEIALLACDLPDGTCTKVTPLPGVEGGQVAAIGIGEQFWAGPGEASGTGPEVEAPETSSTERPE